MHRPEFDLAAVRRRLQGVRGREYWRSLEELAEDDGFRAAIEREFPEEARSLLDPVDRRRFLKLMGASMALAGLGACTRQPRETIVPYVKQPEQVIPGKPLYYASAALHGGYAAGVLVESHMGRPTKIEGNPDHPASLGATDVFAQASLLDLYDPDRSQVTTHLARMRPWSALVATLQAAITMAESNGGATVRILSGTVTSPTLAAQIAALRQKLPRLRWHRWEPVHVDGARAGAQRAFGEIVDTQLRLAEADVVLALDADFLNAGPGAVRYTKDFMARRRAMTEKGGHGRSVRLYAAESAPTVTGSVADHRLPLRASEVESFARAVAAALGVGPEAAQKPEGERARWIAAVAADLRAHAGRALVVAGDPAPAAVHAVAHAINDALGAVGKTVVYTAPVEAEPVEALTSIRELAEDMDAGNVDGLLILGTNPVFDAPAELEFAKRLTKVGLRVHSGLHADETAELCHWHVPAAHPLESWSDARAYDGTATIVQPLIETFYGGKTAHEILAVLAGRVDATAYDLVREHWQKELGGDFERQWRKALHDGVVAGSEAKAKGVALDRSRALAVEATPAARDGYEVIFRPDSTLHDGRYANNGWLQELPKTLTRLTWDNAALVGPATAEKLGVRGGDLVEIEVDGRKATLPVWIQPGQPADALTLPFGYGRRRVGRVGGATGFDVYPLRTSKTSSFAIGAKVTPTGDRHALACTQTHHSMEDRPIIRRASLAHYEEHPEFAQHLSHQPKPGETIHPLPTYEGNAWGMAIDLSTCTGCSACVIACQAENNIAVVGKTEVGKGREMHWLRVDRYYTGDVENPETFQQPLPCMHCETAPCELVCPVAATVHSSDGLNDMVYNRCVGTRYCANNCPYKVRRFNFFLYSDWTTESLKSARNPDVTVRSRGVMEKCTYCVQRISQARIDAEREGRKIRDGEVVTACQQVCPAEAIVFGDQNDPESRVAKLKADPRNYGLLAELNTRPRTTYLAAIRNPNPALVDDEHGGGHDEGGHHG